MTAPRPSLRLLAHGLFFHSMAPRALVRRYGRTAAGEAPTIPPDLGGAARILVIRPDRIGDVVMTSAFLRELRRNAPRAGIWLVVNHAAAPIVETCPYIDHVLTLDTEGLRVPVRYRRVRALARSALSGHAFDLAILPRWDVDRAHATFLALLSGARCRVGFSETVTPGKAIWNRDYDTLLTHPISDDGAGHEVTHTLNLLRRIGGRVESDVLEIWPTAGDQAAADAALAAAGLGSARLRVALAPGARESRRGWPLARYAELAARLRHDLDAAIVVVGDRADRTAGAAIGAVAGTRALNAAGRLTLRESAALIGKCRLFVGNDTGAMHMAAAVGTPVVEISGHPATGRPDAVNAPARFGPWHTAHRVLQPAQATPPCGDECLNRSAHCILAITTEMVQRAIIDLLHETAP